MVVNNPNNWHWVDKNCLAWAKDYFNRTLVGVHAADGAKSAQVSAVSSVEGDCEVSQRKGKVISLFDMKLVLQFTGKVGDVDLSGSITVPELAYDSDPDDIQFAISIYNEDSLNDPIKAVVRTGIVPQLREFLGGFGAVLIKTHSSDIQLEQDKVTSQFTKANQAAAQPTATPAKAAPSATAAQPTATAKSTASAPAAATKASLSSVPKYNTSTLHLEPVFNTTAEQLYITLLDPQRVAAWSRSPPYFAPLPAATGSAFKLFGGSISGQITKLVPNELIQQTWRLDDWKDGHFATLSIALNQGSSETKMVVKFDGIPVGQEDRVRGNFEDYYIRSIKITFGFGAVL